MNTRARVIDRVAISVIRGVAALLCALLVAIVVNLIAAGFGELTRAGFYVDPPNIAGPGSGIGPQLFNTVYILLLSMAMVVPLGLGMELNSWINPIDFCVFHS